eukprot:6671704-Ditylum_brightwellii.AAC.1
MSSCCIIHRPRSLSRGQSLSRHLFAGMFVAKNLHKYQHQVCQLCFEGLAWFGHGVTGQNQMSPVRTPHRIISPLSSHKSARFVEPKNSLTLFRWSNVAVPDFAVSKTSISIRSCSCCNFGNHAW